MFIGLRHGFDSESKQLWSAGCVAAAALVLRGALLLVEKKWLGNIDQVLLAVASGAIASFLILWLQKESPPPIEESLYSVTWTFSDCVSGCNSGEVEMRYHLVQERINRSGKRVLGWKRTWLEPYIGTRGIKSASVKVANKKADLHSDNSDGVHELPVAYEGFVISLKKERQGNKYPDEVYIEEGKNKWFSIEAAMVVPDCYWDTAVGQKTLGKPPFEMLDEASEFEMTDNTSKELTLILVGPNNELSLT